MEKVTCIVPAYNEAERIDYILNFLSSYQRIDEVIVVNDGSTDNTKSVVESLIENNSKFKFINKINNEGKGAAIKDGLTEASGDIIIISDADIFRIDNNCFDVLIDNLNNNVRMVVLDTSFIRRFPLSITGMTRLWSGQRSFYKEDLSKLDWDKAYGYALESSLNDQYISKSLKCKYVFAFGADSALQFEKKGSGFEGVAFYLKISSEIFSRYGVLRLLWQRINSPINAISFAYFVKYPKWIRIVLSPFTLSMESIYGVFICIYSNILYLIARTKRKEPKIHANSD